MNQANVSKLVSRLNFNVKPKYRRLRNPDGPEGRCRKIQKTLTALLKYERLELNYQRADEVRGYADRLISEAIRHGPSHKETMELANFWIREKQFVHKLFKVLVPRYEDYATSFTKLHKAPFVCPTPNGMYERAVLELRGNVFPPIETRNPHEPHLLHNALLAEAKREFRLEKYKKLAESLAEKPAVNNE